MMTNESNETLVRVAGHELKVTAVHGWDSGIFRVTNLPKTLAPTHWFQLTKKCRAYVIILPFDAISDEHEFKQAQIEREKIVLCAVYHEHGSEKKRKINLCGTGQVFFYKKKHVFEIEE